MNREKLEKLRLSDKKEVLPVRSEFDAAKNIRLVPKFQEKAVDTHGNSNRLLEDLPTNNYLNIVYMRNPASF
jgi:hypothetical protein